MPSPKREPSPRRLAILEGPRREDDCRLTIDEAIISTDHPDTVTYRRAADAFNAGDLDALATTIHEDVIWHLAGSTWMARDLAGRAALLAFLREIMHRTGGTFKLRDVCVSGCDDHVLAVQRFGATVDGEERFFDVSSVMHFSDGRQKERWFHIHNPSTFDDFFARFWRQSGLSAGHPPWPEPSQPAATSFSSRPTSAVGQLPSTAANDCQCAKSQWKRKIGEFLSRRETPLRRCAA